MEKESDRNKNHAFKIEILPPCLKTLVKCLMKMMRLGWKVMVLM